MYIFLLSCLLSLSPTAIAATLKEDNPLSEAVVHVGGSISSRACDMPLELNGMPLEWCAHTRCPPHERLGNVIGIKSNWKMIRSLPWSPIWSLLSLNWAPPELRLRLRPMVVVVVVVVVVVPVAMTIPTKGFALCALRGPSHGRPTHVVMCVSVKHARIGSLANMPMAFYYAQCVVSHWMWHCPSSKSTIK